MSIVGELGIKLGIIISTESKRTGHEIELKYVDEH